MDCLYLNVFENLIQTQIFYKAIFLQVTLYGFNGYQGKSLDLLNMDKYKWK